VSPAGASPDESYSYVAPDRLKLNHWALAGDWTLEKRASVLNQADGRISFRFHARDVHLVMGPPERGTSVPFRVLLDGDAPNSAHGLDIDEDGHGAVTQQRLHQLIRQEGPIDDRTFEITFLAPGVEAYAFTFG
jgi:thioredoxin family protein